MTPSVGRRIASVSGRCYAATVLIALGLLLVAVEPCSAVGLRLDWSRNAAASGCPSGASIEAGITERLGCTPFDGPAMATLEVRLSRHRRGWKADLTRYDDGDRLVTTRTLVSDEPECGVLGDALILMGALVAEELPVRPLPVPEAPPPKGPDQPLDPPPRIVILPVTTTVAAAARPGPPALVALVGSVGVGTFPEPAGGAQFMARWRVDGYAGIDVGLTALPMRDYDGFAFGLLAGFVSGCAIGDLSPGTALELCARVRAGQLSAASAPEAVAPTDAGGFAWLAGAAVGRAVIRAAGPVYAVLEIEGLVTLHNRRFTYCTVGDETGCDVGGVANEEAPVSLLASFGLGIEFRGPGE